LWLWLFGLSSFCCSSLWILGSPVQSWPGRLWFEVKFYMQQRWVNGWKSSRDENCVVTSPKRPKMEILTQNPILKTCICFICLLVHFRLHYSKENFSECYQNNTTLGVNSYPNKLFIGYWALPIRAWPITLWDNVLASFVRCLYFKWGRVNDCIRWHNLNDKVKICSLLVLWVIWPIKLIILRPDKAVTYTSFYSHPSVHSPLIIILFSMSIASQ
jgi:hypothetical protein